MAISIALNPSTVARNPSPPLAIGVTGTGFAPGERINLFVSGLVMCSCNADQSGNLATAIPNPAVTLGVACSLSVSATGINGTASATLTVT